MRLAATVLRAFLIGTLALSLTGCVNLLVGAAMEQARRHKLNAAVAAARQKLDAEEAAARNYGMDPGAWE